MSKKKRSTAKGVNKPGVNKSKSKKVISKPSVLSFVKRFLLNQLASLIFKTIFQDQVDIFLSWIKALFEDLF